MNLELILKLTGLFLAIELIVFIALKALLMLEARWMMKHPENLHTRAMKSLSDIISLDTDGLTGQFMPEEEPDGVSVEERQWAYEQGAADEHEVEKLVRGRKRNLDD